MKTPLFKELKQSLREANEIKRGRLKPGRVFRVDRESSVARVRRKLGLSQSKFAAILGISENTLQVAELGAGAPDADRAGEGAAEDRGEASGSAAGNGVAHRDPRRWT